jgi:hypothetical protein
MATTTNLEPADAAGSTLDELVRDFNADTTPVAQADEVQRLALGALTTCCTSD